MPRSNTTALALVVVATLLVGASLPVLAQLFVTLRTVKRVAERLDERARRTLSEMDEAAARVRRLGEPTEAVSAIGAALVPAAIAAFRAMRAHLQEAPSAAHTTNGEANGRARATQDAREEASP